MFFNTFFGCIFMVLVLYRGVNILSHFAGLRVFFELYVGGYKVFFCFNFHFVFCKASFCFRFNPMECVTVVDFRLLQCCIRS